MMERASDKAVSGVEGANTWHLFPVSHSSSIPVFQHSSIPVFQHSSIPAFQHSNIPV